MRVVSFTIKFILFIVVAMLALVWMAFFGIFGALCFASVLFAPVGVASFGLATMPLFAALAWMGFRRPRPQQVTIINNIHSGTDQ